MLHLPYFLISIPVVTANNPSMASENVSEKIHKCFGDSFHPSQKYVIAIQGVSTSGKSTFAIQLHERITQMSIPGCRSTVISTDNFYRHDPFQGKTPEEIEKYDFDNPRSIDWDALASCVREHLIGSKKCPTSNYCFIKRARTVGEIENPGFNVIILEGIFGHNLFNNEVFDVDNYDACNSAGDIGKPPVKNPYLQNFPKCKVLKIFLDLNEKTMRSTRIKVDKERSQIDEAASMKWFDEKIYPATLNWVRPTGRKQCDILLENGSRDVDKCVGVFENIVRFFNKDFEGGEFGKYLKGLASGMNVNN